MESSNALNNRCQPGITQPAFRSALRIQCRRRMQVRTRIIDIANFHHVIQARLEEGSAVTNASTGTTTKIAISFVGAARNRGQQIWGTRSHDAQQRNDYHCYAISNQLPLQL